MSDLPGNRAAFDPLTFIECVDSFTETERTAWQREASALSPSAELDACRALVSCACGDTSAALNWARRTPARTADVFAYARGVIFLHCGDVAAAIEPLEQIGAGFVKFLEARLLLATALMCTGRLTDAEAIAQQLSDLDDELEAARLGLRARCAAGRGDNDEAQVHYRAALALGPHLDWVREALVPQVDPPGKIAGAIVL